MQQDLFAKGSVVDPRLSFSGVSQILVRGIRALVLLGLLAGSLYVLFVGEERLLSLGLLGLLFFVERLVYRKASERTVVELLEEDAPNLTQGLSPQSVSLLQEAQSFAKQKEIPFVFGFLDLCVRTPDIEHVLLHTEVDLDALRLTRSMPGRSAPESYGPAIEEIVRDAARHAVIAHHESITPHDLFVGLIGHNDVKLKAYLTEIGLDATMASLAVRMEEQRTPVRRRPRVIAHHVMNRAWTSRTTPTLDLVSTDLTDQARAGALPRLIGHEASHKQLMHVLARPTRPHALLVGQTGSGRSVVIGALAQSIVAGTAPAALLDRRLVEIDIPSLFARAGSNPAELIKKVGDEIIASGNIILYFPDIDHLTQTQGAASLALVDVLLPILHTDTFPVLATTTQGAYARTLEQRGDIVGSFETVRLDLLTARQVEEVVLVHARHLERRYRIPVTIGAIQAASRLAVRYLAPDHPVPGSAIELFEESLGQVASAKGKRLTAVAVEQVLEERVGTKVASAGADEAAQLLALEETIQKEVVGQDEAVGVVANALRAHRTGLIPGTAPPSFLFVGSTGVGKTKLAQTVARSLFGKESFLRLDMSEFSRPESIERLLGKSDGSLSGMLTDPVRKHPRMLILLDELEKADPSVVRLLLQLLSEGRLTDGTGTLVSYTDAVVIATSNAGTAITQEALRRGEHMADIARYLRQKLSDFFPPELLNRFTRVVVFNDLQPDALRRIAEIKVSEMASLLEERYGVLLSADRAALDELVRKGYEPTSGARALGRSVEQAIEQTIAPKILEGSLARGKAVTLTYRDNGFFLVD